MASYARSSSESAGVSVGGDEGRGPRIERVRASLRAAKFTGKGDDKVVVGLYNRYITKIGTAMVDSGEGMDFVYEGEYKGGAMEGFGTYQYVDGRAEVGRYAGNVDVGEGVVGDKRSGARP